MRAAVLVGSGVIRTWLHRLGPLLLQLLLGRRHRLHGVLANAKVDGVPLGPASLPDAELVFRNTRPGQQFRPRGFWQVWLGRSLGLLFRSDFRRNAAD